MASVLNSRAAKCARRGLSEDEAPEHVLSAGEILIKQLARKQTNTNITLEEQLKEKKEFEHGIGCVRIEEFSPGTSTLQEFKEKHQRAEMIQEFKCRGVSREEAEAELRGSNNSKISSVGDQMITQEQLVCKPSPRFEDSVSRRELELAASVKPNSLETRLYKFAMQNKSPVCVKWEHPDHPIHNLAEMEQTLAQISAADPQKLAKTVRRKRRQLLEALDEPSIVHFKPPEPQSSLWDCIEPPMNVSNRPPKPTKVATCRRETLYTIREGQIVPLNARVNGKSENKHVEKHKERTEGQPFVSMKLPSEELKVSGRLTEQELKQLPRFENYERGIVSNILYIKNLSSSVTEEDLVALFARFQEKNCDKIIYRLMNGKMRGQAFVTFKSCEVAAKALEEINGTILQGKPMVIQFGKHKT